MKPAPFVYVAARSLEEALALKAQHGGEAMFLAGGQSLMPMLNFRLAQPAVLIDINAVPDCDGVRLNDGELRVGALTRYRTLQASADIAAHAPLIADALPLIAHPQIRNRGTIGGNLSHADPASELPAATVALDARMRLRSSTAERWVAAESFFTGALATALAPDEMLAEIAWPAIRPGDGRAFLEVSRRQGDYAMMGVAAVISLDANARCTRARLAFCAAGDGPVLADTAAAALIGGTLEEPAIAAAANLAGSDIDPGGTIHATPDFQRHLARVLTARALRVARDRALAGLPGHKGRAA